MKKINYVLFFATLLIYNASCQENKPAGQLSAPTTISEAIDQARTKMNEMLSEYPGLSITIGIKDSIIWSEGFGYADVSKKVIVNTSHQFRFYSLSKSITGMALIKLIESGELDIEKSVRNYLPRLPEAYQNVKIKELIAHTAGIRNYKKGEWMQISQNNCLTAQDALGVFINDPLISEPGVNDSYTTFGYVLLSAVIESISGKSYIEFLKSMIFEPIGINSIEIDKSDNLRNEVTYYDNWSSKNIKGSEAKHINNTCKFGAGGLAGTTRDFVNLHLKMLNNQLCEKPFTEMYYSSLKKSNGEAVNYAFGIGDNINQSGIRTHSHSGSGLGGNAIFAIYPDSKLVIAIAGNIESKEMNGKIGEIAKLFLGLKL